MKKLMAVILGSLLSTVAAAKEPAGIDACSLLSAGEVRKAVGHDVQAGERHDSGAFSPSDEPGPAAYSSTCLWRIKLDGEAPVDPDPSIAGANFVMVNAIRWPAGSGGSQHYLQSFRDAAEDGSIDQEPSPVAIGDEALWWGDGVALRKGEASVGVSVHLAGEREKERGLEEALAKLIAGRLSR